MLTLKELHIDYQERDNRFRNISNLTDTWVGRLKQNNLVFALYSYFEEQDIKKARQHFYVCGMLDAYRIKTYEDRMFDYDLHSIGYAMLSDNVSFINPTCRN